MSRIAEKFLERIVNEQQQEINELKAQVERLREALNFVLHTEDERYLTDYINDVLSETPPQSLNHIKAQV